ncbi:MAG TPA: VOC family protein [Bryobacteraceae bacterium]|nr:VOC family protein [Bryobacteraceae bacterium]
MRLLLLFGLLPALWAQLPAPGDSGVTMGHIHLLVRDIGAQQKFWTEVVGAKPYQLGRLRGVEVPGAIILFQQGTPSGGSVGSAMNHIGFLIKDLDAALERAKSFGSTIQSVSPAGPTRPLRQAMLFAPDEIRVELSEDKNLPTPVANHHLHWMTSDLEATRGWYVKLFGAKPGKRGQFEAADLPGVNLSFTPSDTAQAPTRGRAIDHVGFEVVNLKAFVEKLQAQGVKFDVAYKKLDDLGLKVAFLTDGSGTYLELTEGLRK